MYRQITVKEMQAIVVLFHFYELNARSAKTCIQME